MIQAVRLTDTENHPRSILATGTDRREQVPGPGILATLFSVVALATFASLFFYAAHSIAAGCSTPNVLELMRACGTSVAVG